MRGQAVCPTGFANRLPDYPAGCSESERSSGGGVQFYITWADAALLDGPALEARIPGCRLRCSFCPRRPETGADGPPPIHELGEALARALEGGICWAVVSGGSPEANLPLALSLAGALQEHLMVAWESPLYMSPAEARLVSEAADLIIGDLRFGPGRCAERLAGVDAYWATATETARLLLRRGRFLPRHTVIPGHLRCCTEPALAWLGVHAPGARVHLVTSFLDGEETLSAAERAEALSLAARNGLRGEDGGLGAIPPTSAGKIVLTTDGRILIPE